MKYLDALLQLGCFSFDDAVMLAGNKQAASSMLLYYAKHGAVIQIRKGLYSAVNPLDKEPVANKYLIASKLNETAVVSHHSAFEYHGYANQVSYRVSVSSQSKFNSFEFGGYTFVRFPTSIEEGIETTSHGERITDIERTVIDSINDFEKDMGFEELIQCLSAIPFLDESKLLLYLKAYGKCFLYQKAGFVFDHLNDDFGFSDGFFNVCKENAGNSSRYLLKDMNSVELAFSNKWHLTYPKTLWRNMIGGEINAEI